MKEFIETLLQAGAYKAAVIETSQIPFDKTLRDYCAMNYCGQYGKNWACPPCVGEPDELIERAKKYKYTLVFQTVSGLEDSFDFEGMQAASNRHAKLSETFRGIVAENTLEYLELTAGGCNICKQCAKLHDEPCRFPEKAISSLEAYCMQVSQLAEVCGMKYINGKDTVTYFGAYLYNK